jgi:hypothetical protein
MKYNRAVFAYTSMNRILIQAVVVGICFYFGWSTAFLFFGLLLLGSCIQFPLTFIIREIFSKEKAVILEALLTAACVAVVAQQLLAAECIKLFIIATIYAASVTIYSISAMFSEKIRRDFIERVYGSLLEEGDASSANPSPNVNPDLDLTDYITGAPDDLPRPSATYSEAFEEPVPPQVNQKKIPADNMGIPADLGEKILGLSTSPEPRRRTATPN